MFRWKRNIYLLFYKLQHLYIQINFYKIQNFFINFNIFSQILIKSTFLTFRKHFLKEKKKKKRLFCVFQQLLYQNYRERQSKYYTNQCINEFKVETVKSSYLSLSSHVRQQQCGRVYHFYPLPSLYIRTFPSLSQPPQFPHSPPLSFLFSGRNLLSSLSHITKMAKGTGKLTNLKSVLKKWNSFSKLNRPNVSPVISAADDDSSTTIRDLHPVYVGKSRRRYLVSSDVVDHPVLRELAERSGDSDDTINVACEVVLFEHLLWMLENADPQPESMNELVEFYAC